ncbi:MAG: hypothetical protein E6G68_07510 [Actinobacteria bacterium]|nr:MAG: hypothetical protein E6G68_07510 [Actinomycetota bacterium]
MTLPSDAWGTNIPVLGFAAVTSHVITADPTPPSVLAFAPAVAQTDNIAWQLSESVIGVGPSTVSFRVHGTPTEVPSTISFDDVTHRVIVHPPTPLTAGQYYDADLLPDGPGGIVDRAGNQLDPDSRSFRVTTVVNETVYGTAYSWRTLTSSSAVVWYTITDPYQGVAGVTIDGHSKGTVNNYSSTAKYKVARTFSGLSSGTHTITIRVAGTKSSSSKDVRVSIDAFKDSGTYKGTPSVGYRWAAVSSSSAEGGSYRAARFSGTYMTFTFRGTSIDWRTTLGPGMGRALVSVDGVGKGTIDNYAGVTITNYERHFGALSDAVHTIKIMVASTRNPSASNSVIVVDGFLIDQI